jgi:hypothetical protein
VRKAAEPTDFQFVNVTGKTADTLTFFMRR